MEPRNVGRRVDSLRTQKRILSACVRLFLEKGYHQTLEELLPEDEERVSA